MYNPELKRDAGKAQGMWTVKLQTVVQGCIAFYADSKRPPTETSPSTLAHFSLYHLQQADHYRCAGSHAQARS